MIDTVKAFEKSRYNPMTFYNGWMILSINTFCVVNKCNMRHYSDVIMDTMASQITSLTIVYSTVYSCSDQRNKSSASLAFVRGIPRWLVNSPRKWPVTRKMFPFDDVIMKGAEICRTDAFSIMGLVSYPMLRSYQDRRICLTSDASPGAK